MHPSRCKRSRTTSPDGAVATAQCASCASCSSLRETRVTISAEGGAGLEAASPAETADFDSPPKHVTAHVDDPVASVAPETERQRTTESRNGGAHRLARWREILYMLV